MVGPKRPSDYYLTWDINLRLSTFYLEHSTFIYSFIHVFTHLFIQMTTVHLLLHISVVVSR